MDIEFREGISEVIATTRNDRPNAAPIGIINRKNLYAVLYKESHTFSNVKKNGQLVANFVLDPLLYVMTAFEDLDASFFRSDQETPVLQAAYAWVEFRCSIAEKPTQTSAVIHLHPVKSVVLRQPMIPTNRAFCAIIEATIHATRYRKLKDSKYLELAFRYESIVRKCGGAQELEAFQLLKKYLG
jgi:hypothetical protein